MHDLDHAIEAVPPGNWAVAVSGGADSVALFELLRRRTNLGLHVVHLDHQTRGEASDADAAFVAGLAEEFGVPCTVARRGEVEATMRSLPGNPSARYRAARTELFRQVVARHALQGIILAHHADDQAETVLLRILRGSGPMGLAGMSAQTCLGGGVRVVRPLLKVRRETLREYLRSIGRSWREDASNASDRYLRNRLRKWLATEPEVHAEVLELADACREVREWVRRAAPELGEAFTTEALRGLSGVLARESARRWLCARGCPPGELSETVLDRLVEMANDAASPARQHFPGAVLVRRRRGVMEVVN